MKKKEYKALEAKKLEELKKLVSDKKIEATLARAKAKVGQEKNSSKAKNLRRDVAQILTLIRQKELLEMIEKKKEENK